MMSLSKVCYFFFFQLPSVTHSNYQDYLAKVDKHPEEKVRQLYEEEFILSIRSACEDGITFIKARLAAEMKKKISYNVDVSVDEHGVVVECQCDCGAGMGPEAHCKHVCVIIFALIKFSHLKHITVRKTCT